MPIDFFDVVIDDDDDVAIFLECIFRFQLSWATWLDDTCTSLLCRIIFDGRCFYTTGTCP